MKHLNSFIVPFMFIATIFFSGCSDDDEKTEPIVVNDEKALDQNVYADKTEGSGVSFTTAGAWTSTIKSAPAARADLRDTSTAPDWLSITPSSGNAAGNYNVSINLEPNKTGSDRSATISILCAGSEITINVTQKGTKEDGTVPARNISFKVFSCNEEWIPDENPAYLPADTARIIVYDKDSVMVGTYVTNSSGIANVELEDGEYKYRVMRGNESNIVGDGFLVVGMYLGKDMETSPGVPLGFPKVKDLNGDGIINAEDKVEYATIRVVKDEEIEVYIAALDFMSVYSPAYIPIRKNNMQDAYRYMINYSYHIDALMTQELRDKVSDSNLMNYTFDATQQQIYSLWNASYDVIKNANYILEKIDIVFGFSDSERNNYKTEALYHRMYAYSVLLNYFGGVPIQIAYTFEDVPRATIQEVADIIFNDGDFVVENANERSMRDAAFQIMARVALNKADFRDAYTSSKRIVDEGGYNLSADPENNWGMDAISEPVQLALRVLEKVPYDNNLYPVRYTETLLLFAESALGEGRIMEAIEIVNIFALTDGKNPVFPNSGATQEEVRNAITSIWKEKLNIEGHTFAMLKRTGRFIDELGPFGAKEKHMLLPIPAQAVKGDVTQNPGW